MTPRQDHFAREYVASGGDLIAAYRAAYMMNKPPESVDNRSAFQRGSRLLKVPGMASAIAGYRGDRGPVPVVVTAAPRALDFDVFLAELDRLAKVAEERGNLPAAIRAQELRGRACGFFEDRICVTTQRADEMDRDTLLKIARSGVA